MERTAIVRNDRILDILGGLERAGRTLGRLEDILVLGARLGVEPLGSDGYFSELEALSVTLVHALVRWPYCDDPLWSRNLQLQVRIVGHDHKLRVCRPPEDHMVRPREPHHLPFFELILVIHVNTSNGTNHLVEHVFVGISRSHGCYHKLTYHAQANMPYHKLTYNGHVRLLIANLRYIFGGYK
jgi:hypothetical protein